MFETDPERMVCIATFRPYHLPHRKDCFQLLIALATVTGTSFSSSDPGMREIEPSFANTSTQIGSTTLNLNVAFKNQEASLRLQKCLAITVDCYVFGLQSLVNRLDYRP